MEITLKGYAQNFLNPYHAVPQAATAGNRSGFDTGEQGSPNIRCVTGASERIAAGLKAHFPWYGGKSRSADLIWSMLGDPKVYAEPFAGSLAVLLRRPPTAHHRPREMVVDIDHHVARGAWKWALEHGEVYRIAYCCHDGDFDAPDGWLKRTDTFSGVFSGVRKRQGNDRRRPRPVQPGLHGRLHAAVRGGRVMRVLVARGFSGVVRDALIGRGHDAVSCDPLPSERPGPYYRCDATEIIRASPGHWDLLVAHPPCTHLAVSGARWLRGDPGRMRLHREASTFFQ